MRRLLGPLLISGCVPASYTWTPSFARSPARKPEGCAFEVVTSPPARGYEEVGTLTF